jgi:beta-N-acetylhexosaminidase
MTPRVLCWLRFGLLVVAFACLTAPAAGAAGLADRTGRWAERIGDRLQAAPDPVAGLSDAQLAGQRVVVGFNGTSAPGFVLDRIARGELGGVILFSRNIRSRGQVRSLTASLQRAAANAPGGGKALVMVDQEGGQVSRVPGPPRRSPAQVGSSGRTSVARHEGRATGRNLAGVGINVDLAPVVDVARPGTNMEQLGRSYGGDTGLVSSLAAAFASGLRTSGVLSCAKHFPGLGLARGDEDFHLNRITESLDQLRTIDEPPFTAAGTELVMVSTGIYPALDSAPALFSRRITTGELRAHLGFGGTTITDDLEVPAISRRGSPGERAMSAAAAGNDILLFAQSPGAGISAASALRRALGSGKLDRTQFQTSTRRVLDLRSRL